MKGSAAYISQGGSSGSCVPPCIADKRIPVIIGCREGPIPLLEEVALGRGVAATGLVGGRDKGSQRVDPITLRPHLTISSLKILGSLNHPAVLDPRTQGLALWNVELFQ